MTRAFKFFVFSAIFICFFVFTSCGTKEPTSISINLIVPEGDSPFDDASGVADIIYVIHDATDSSRSSLYYPQACVSGTEFPSRCGFTKSEEVNLKLCFEECTSPASGAYIPAGNQAVVHFCARDENGIVLFWGDSDPFENDPSVKVQQIDLPVTRQSRSHCLYPS